MAIFYFMMIRPQQKRQKDIQKAREVLEAALEESWGGRLLDWAPALEESATAVVRDGARRNEKEA